MIFQFKNYLFASIFMFISPAFAEKNEWVVSEAQAQCILENINSYIETGATVIIIRAALCPETNPFSKSIKSKSNFGGVSNVTTKKDHSGTDDIITYKAEDLLCLKRNLTRFENGLAYLPKKIKCTP